MIERVQKIVKDLNQANQQRRRWLYASSIIFIGVVVYVSGWHWIHNLANPYIEWSFISVGLIVTVNWWYWTMSLVRQYINHQKGVMEILDGIVGDLKSIKTDVKNLNKPVDKED